MESSAAQEAKLFARISGPSVVMSLLMMLQWTYTSSFVGSRFGTTELTGVSLANLSGNLIVMSILLGFLTACETMQPQEFAKGNFAEVGRIGVRSFVVCLGFLAALTPLWQHLDEVLIWLKQPEESSRLAQRFLTTYMFAFPGVAFVESALRFFRAQNVVAPFMVMQAIALVAHVVWLHVFVVVLDCGFDGAAMAHCAAVYTYCVLIVGLFRFGSYHHPDSMPRLVTPTSLCEAFSSRKDVELLFRLGLPGILSMSDWWFWEVVCFFSGEFGEESLAAHTIAYSLIPLNFMVPLGIGSGITTRAGALLAEGKVEMARRLSGFAVVVCQVIVLANAVAAYGLRHHAYALFTDDAAVIAQCERIWPWVSLFMFADALMGAQTGIMRALSLQAAMSGAVVLSLWLIGVPLIWFLAVHQEQGLLGIWQAMPACYMLLNALLLAAHQRLDWSAYSLSLRADEPASGPASISAAPRLKAMTFNSATREYEMAPFDDLHDGPADSLAVL